MAADDRYDPKFFEQFRKQDLTRTAVQYAQVNSDHLILHKFIHLTGYLVAAGWKLAGCSYLVQPSWRCGVTSLVSNSTCY